MLQPNDVIRQYRVVEVIAKGGMARVYLAFDENLQVPVALKELHGHLIDDQEQVQRFHREAMIAASLEHPNIVTVRDYFVENDNPYLVMPYFPLGSTRPLIRAISHRQLAGLLTGVLKGLRAADKKYPGIVHRDLKPANLMRTDEGGVAITDFGIAKILGPSEFAPTEAGYFKGTPEYVAPEVVVAGGKATVRSDLYALGVIAYEMLRGKPPFALSAPAKDILARKRHESAIPIQVVDPDLDMGIATWINRQLERDPRHRYGSADEALQALEAAATVAFSPGWQNQAELPVAEEPLAVEAPPTEIASHWGDTKELRSISGSLRRLFLYALLDWRTLVLPAVLGTAGVVGHESGLVVLAIIVLVVTVPLRFFDVREAFRLRGLRAKHMRASEEADVVKAP